MRTGRMFGFLGSDFLTNYKRKSCSEFPYPKVHSERENCDNFENFVQSAKCTATKTLILLNLINRNNAHLRVRARHFLPYSLFVFFLSFIDISWSMCSLHNVLQRDSLVCWTLLFPPTISLTDILKWMALYGNKQRKKKESYEHDSCLIVLHAHVFVADGRRKRWRMEIATLCLRTYGVCLIAVRLLILTVLRRSCVRHSYCWISTTISTPLRNAHCGTKTHLGKRFFISVWLPMQNL